MIYSIGPRSAACQLGIGLSFVRYSVKKENGARGNCLQYARTTGVVGWQEPSQIKLAALTATREKW